MVNLQAMFKRKKKKDFPQTSFFDRVKQRCVQKKKMIKRILILLVSAFLAYRFFAGPYGFIQIHSLVKEKRSLENQSRMLQAELVDLEIEKKRLADDPFYLEKQARERLGLIKEGEKVYRIIHMEKSDSTLQKKTIPTSPSDSSIR